MCLRIYQSKFRKTKLLNQRHKILLYCEKHKININVWVEEVIFSRKAFIERKLNCLLEQLRKISFKHPNIVLLYHKNQEKQYKKQVAIFRLTFAIKSHKR